MNHKHNKPIKFTTIIDEEHRRVYAIAKFAGKAIRGVAKCSPNDTFNPYVGEELAKARCRLKIAKKKLERAISNHSLALEEGIKASQRLENASKAMDEMRLELEACEVFLGKFEAATMSETTNEVNQ